MSDIVKDFHYAAHKAEAIADWIEMQADAYRVLQHKDRADALTFRADLLREAVQMMRDAWSEQLQSSFEGSQLHAGAMLATILHFADVEKDKAS